VTHWTRDEHELVRRCREGSEAAYVELVRQHRSRLFGLAYRLLGDRALAEDVVQETFLAAFRSMDRVEPRPSLAPWLNTIAVRLAGRTASRYMARPRTSLDRMTDGAWDDEDPRGFAYTQLAALERDSDPHAHAETAELRRRLTEAFASLPFKYRAAVVLRFVQQMDYAEAAETLELPLNTYKSHLLRGTRMLRDLLEPELLGVEEETPAIAAAAISSSYLQPEPVAAGSARRRTEPTIG
jgi:RNA polymerase sigma-70 factor (ECF subfamily)